MYEKITFPGIFQVTVEADFLVSSALKETNSFVLHSSEWVWLMAREL